MQTITIGGLAKQVGVGTGTLRYYERLGLLAPAQRTASGYRVYGADAGRRLRFIRRAQELGFSLDEIGVLLMLNHNPQAPAGEVKRITEDKIGDIDARIKDLIRMKQGLQRLAQRCSGHGSATDCPILAALNEDL